MAVGDGGGRVLVVDDDEGLARFIVEVLADAGHHAEAAASGAAARRRVEAGAFDVVVTDLRMPGESGLDLIAWLRRYDPRIAVLAITAFGSLETAVQAMRLGAADYIPKPFEPAALLLAIDKSLRAHAMRAEIERLRTEADDRYGFDALVVESEVMRELDALPAEEMRARAEALEAAADAPTVAPWMTAMAGYHALMRAALAIKRAGGDAAAVAAAREALRTAIGLELDDGDLAAIARPPRGRLGVYVFARLGASLGRPPEALWQAMFPTARADRFAPRAAVAA